jgi:enediyne biosynthesis protein E4
MSLRSVRSALVVAIAVILVLVSAVFAVWRPWQHEPGALPAQSGFRECATEVGITWQMRFLPDEQGEKFKINLYDHGCGLAVGDFDGDGHDDIYFCNQLGPNALYRNKGDGTFEEVAEAAGVALGDRVCVGATFVDFDNDGRQDLFVTSTRGGNVLFRNMGGGKFKDVTKEAGLTLIAHSQTACFFDYDNDGFLDLLVTNSAEWTTGARDGGAGYFLGKEKLLDVFRSPKETNVLYHNNGDGTFTDVTEKAGLKGQGWAGDTVAFDFDGDGLIDLFVTSMVGRCQLYRNNGNGTFTDVTDKTLGRTPWGAIGAQVLDANNDGKLDLFVVDMHSDMWMGIDLEHRSLSMAKEFKNRKFPTRLGPFGQIPGREEEERILSRQMGYRLEDVVYGNAFYRNEGSGKFTEISEQAGLETFWPWGIATGDYDNDGFEDVFLPSGMGYPYYYWPNGLLMNQRNGTFRDEAAERGIEPPRRGRDLPNKIAGRRATRSSRCAVTADFRGAGQLDIVTNNFNDQPYYFKNEFPAQNYLEFRLHGTKSNRDAIGAVVRVYRGQEILTRQVLSACGYLSQSSKTVHFGLGENKRIDRVEITWPSGIHQRLDDVSINSLNDIVEPAPSHGPAQ